MRLCVFGCTIAFFWTTLFVVITSVGELLGAANETTLSLPDFDVSGINISIAPFRKDKPLLSNRRYKLNRIPAKFKGWSYTQIVGGSQTLLRVKCKKDCEVYCLTAINEEVIDITGWEIISTNLNYSDHKKTKMGILVRKSKAGDQFEIPAGTWVGGMILIPPAT
jgi:hypothetical protein